jgi:hypothetical protein
MNQSEMIALNLEETQKIANLSATLPSKFSLSPFEYNINEQEAFLANLRGLNNMDFFKKHLDKIWGIGIGFVVGFLVAGWASSAGILTGF